MGRAIHGVLAVVVVVALFTAVRVAADISASRSPIAEGDAVMDTSLTSAPDGSPSLPLPEHIEHLTNDSYYAFVQDRQYISVVVFYATWHSHSVEVFQKVENVARRFMEARDVSSLVRFGALHGPHYKELCRHERVNGFPLVRVVVRGLTKQPHVYTGYHFTEDELFAFVQRIAATDKRQAAEATQRRTDAAAKVPKLVNPTPGRVLALDATSFAMYRNSTNILLFALFYAPWCQHCKEPLETLKGVADYFKRDKTIVIAKVDCENDAAFCVEAMNIEGYPTFFTVPKPSMGKEGAKYDGGYDVVDICQHLDKQNQFFDAEGMDEIRQQFEKLRDTPRDQMPQDLSELGGIFSQFKKKGEDEKPKVIGRNGRRGRR